MQRMQCSDDTAAAGRFAGRFTRIAVITDYHVAKLSHRAFAWAFACACDRYRDFTEVVGEDKRHREWHGIELWQSARMRRVWPLVTGRLNSEYPS